MFRYSGSSIMFSVKMFACLTFLTSLLLLGCQKPVCPGDPAEVHLVRTAAVSQNASIASASKSKSTGNAANVAVADPQKAATANLELGLAYLSQGDISRAKGKLNHALELGPLMPGPHSAMAYFLEYVGDHNDAERAHKKAMQYGKKSAATLNNYGAFLYRQGRFQEADAAFLAALEDKKYERRAEVYENAGLCASKLQDAKRAETYFQKAMQQDPSSVKAPLELAQLKVNEKAWFEAKKWLSRHKVLSLPSSRSLWLTIQTAQALKDPSTVQESAQILKTLFSDSEEYQAFLNSSGTKNSSGANKNSGENSGGKPNSTGKIK